MSFASLLLHVWALWLPAWGTAGIFLVASRLLWRKAGWRLPWLTNGLLLGLSGSFILTAMLVATGRDGSMAAYGLMVIAYALIQALLMEQRRG